MAPKITAAFRQRIQVGPGAVICLNGDSTLIHLFAKASDLRMQEQPDRVQEQQSSGSLVASSMVD